MQEAGDSGLRNLVEYAHVVLRRWWIIAATVVLAGGGGYLLSSRSTPVYRASAEVLLQGTTASSTAGLTQVPVDIPTELRVLQGLAVQQAVKTTLPGAPHIASVVQSSDTSFILSVDSATPKLAADAANAYVTAYLNLRRSNGVNDLLAVINQLQAKITSLQQQIAALPPVPTTVAGTAVDPEAAQLNSLETQLAGDQEQYGTLELQLGNVSAGGIVLRPASTPASAFSPRPRRSAAEAAGGGLVAGLGLAFLFEYVDDSVRNADGLERHGRPLPVLGVIPEVVRKRHRAHSSPSVVVAGDPASAAAEAFRSLRTTIRLLDVARPISSIEVTSPAARDGKTTVVANLAVTLAQLGERVVVVDFDLRRPRVHELFGLDNAVGFTSVASGAVKLSDAIQTVPSVKRLGVLTTGPPPPNPVELLSSERTADVLNVLRAQGWLLVVDTPPVLPVTDASIVSRLVDATVLVAAAGSTKRDAVRQSLEVLTRVKAPLIGTVLNRAGTKRRYDYEYGGSYRSTGGAPEARRPSASGGPYPREFDFGPRPGARPSNGGPSDVRQSNGGPSGGGPSDGVPTSPSTPAATDGVPTGPPVPADDAPSSPAKPSPSNGGPAHRAPKRRTRAGSGS